jgi:uroporphyrinogen-III synthase
MQVLLTRPLEDSHALADILKATGMEPIVWPLTRIVPTATSLQIPAATEAILFTSANAVRAFAKLAGRRDLPALCVGEATARSACATGFRDCVAANGNSRSLADLARKSGLREFFHPRGRDTASDLKGCLAQTGHNVTEAVLYRADEAGLPHPPIAAALANGSVNLVTIWSRRGAAILADYLTRIGASLGDTGLLAISRRAAGPLDQSGLRHILIAEAPTQAAMLAKIQAYSADTLK